MAEILMTSLEKLVADWLDKRGILYDLQSSLLGGRAEFGGAVVDFILIESAIILRIMGEYWHAGTIQEAKDREQRTMLENIGYRVVDLQEEDLNTNLDAVMEKAIMGDEMSEIDSDLIRGNPGMAAGMITGLGSPTSKIPSSHTTPIVRTDEPTVSSDTSNLNGTLVYDGSIECDCRFHWGEAEEEENCLSWIFPWTRDRAYYGLNPNICLDVAVFGSHIHITNWKRNKRTDDTFDEAVGTTRGQYYNYKAEAENPSHSVFGSEVIFSGG